MKLFTKIFLQVICVVLLLSSGIFFYTTYRWKNQSIQNINSYENSRFQTNISKFENMLMRIKSKTQDTDDKIREKMIIYAFRQVFHDSAVLYQDGKEQYNGTKYEFDLQNIRNLTKNKHDGFENDSYCDKPLISKTNGNVFLLFYFSSYSSTDMNYQIVTYKDITSVQKQSQTLFYQAGGFTLFLVLFVGFFLFLTLRKIMEPLTRLKEAAVSVANGNYEIKVPSEGKTELAQVGKSFNLMTGKVREQIEKLSSVNQAQRQLLGSLAHELKTPMTAIIGYADTLLTVRLSPKRQEIALDYIRNECRRLSRLSVKMLELTGLYETGEARFAPTENSVKSFLEDSRQLNLCRLKEKNICLELQCEPADLKKNFDKDLLLSLVNNFIDNAVKASADNSKLILAATAGKLMVRDFGKGIPAEDLDKVTEAFYMVDKSRSRANGSVGLGLALCKKIADIHGFQLKIESEIGKGTCVFIEW